MLSVRYVIVPLSFGLLSGVLPAQVTRASLERPALSQAAPLPPTQPLTPERRADILMARKMYREAIEMYEQAPKDSAAVWNKMGIAYHQMLQLDAALKRYRQAIRLDPKFAEAINNAGTIYYARKQYGKAVKYYKRAIKLEPNSASIYSNLGLACYARKKDKEAAAAFNTALRLDPEVFERHGRSGALVQESSVEDRARYHFFQAKLYAKAGQDDRALLCIRKALEEGFKERKQLLQDPEFAHLRDLPQFKELLTLEPRVL